MKFTERELFLAQSAIELYIRSTGKDGLCIDDFNEIIETSPILIQPILQDAGLELGEFRKLITHYNVIKLETLISSLSMRMMKLKFDALNSIGFDKVT